MKNRLSKITDEYEQLVNAGDLIWTPIDLSDHTDRNRLPPKTLEYLDMFVTPAEILVEVADRRLGDTLLFRLDSEYSPYLHHDPTTEIHMWADAGFHNAVDGNTALAKLAERITGQPWESLKASFDEMDRANPVPNN